MSSRNDFEIFGIRDRLDIRKRALENGEDIKISDFEESFMK
ncbi:MAG: hypothetical protein U9R17_09585 [Thermodesulfobacteriota bacterium]|nr:hypothetical protein [Thermodesulfobacteriota bacterium]